MENMRTSKPAYTIPAFLVYLFGPIGWIYALLVHRKNAFVFFHLKQSVGLLLFALGVTVGWFLVGWLLMWIPFGGVLTMALFALVIAGYLFALVNIVIGISNALREEVEPLPFIGQWADNLPLEKVFH